MWLGRACVVHNGSIATIAAGHTPCRKPLHTPMLPVLAWLHDANQCNGVTRVCYVACRPFRLLPGHCCTDHRWASVCCHGMPLRPLIKLLPDAILP